MTATKTVEKTTATEGRRWLVTEVEDLPEGVEIVCQDEGDERTVLVLRGLSEARRVELFAAVRALA